MPLIRIAMPLSAMALCVATGLPAQNRSPLFAFAGDAPGSAFGAAVAHLDGPVPLLAIGAPEEGVGGAVHVHELRTGTRIRTWTSSQSGERFGHALLAIPDLNGDGTEELLVGAPDHDGNRGAVYAHVTSATSPLYVAVGRLPAGRFGYSLARLPDRDADGADDFGCGAPFDDLNGPETGVVRLCSSRTGGMLLEIDAPEAGMQFGYSLASCRDRDLDGIADLIVGAPRTFNAYWGHWDMGSVLTISGRDGAELARWFHDDWFERLGESVAVLKGPGAERALMGARTERYIDPSRMRGSCWLESGGVVLGDRPVNIGDLDADGFDDVLVGQPRGGYGGVGQGGYWVYSGATRAVLDGGFTGPVGGQRGASACAVGDVDGDGAQDLAIGAPGADLVEVFRSVVDPVDPRSLGSAVARGAIDANRDGVDDLVRFVPATADVEVIDLRTNQVLWSLPQRGPAVAILGDVDGDGVRDVAVDQDVVLGATGTIFRSGIAASFASLADAGDLDADGYDDVLIAPDTFTGSPLTAYSARQGVILTTWPVAAAGWAAGDVDGDGYHDVALLVQSDLEVRSGADDRVLVSMDGVGSPSRVFRIGDVDGDALDDPCLQFDGRMEARSGITGALLWRTTPEVVSSFSPSWFHAFSVTDCDGDGVRDLVFGPDSVDYPFMGSARTAVISGRTGRPITVVDGVEFGIGVFLGDTDGDGRDEFANGSKVFSLPRRPVFRAFEPIVPLTGGGQSWAVNAGLAHARQSYLVLGSLSGMVPGTSIGPFQVALRFDGYTAWTLAAANQAPLVANFGTLDHEGRANAKLDVSGGLPSVLRGLHLHHSVVVFDAGGPTLVGETEGLAFY